ncbi:MAG: SUMF1/EgtB/PvdO family nonheme iron enzyme, partial [Planctomycetota bacterium]
KALPVLVSRHEWPTEAALPEPLRPLLSASSKFQIHAAHWDRDFSWFAAELDELLGSREEPAAAQRSMRAVERFPSGSSASEWRSFVLDALGRARLAHQPVSLVEVYVESGLQAHADVDGTTHVEPVRTLLELLERTRRDAGFPRCWVLFGDPGSGKSTVLRHAAIQLAEFEEAVPVYVSLAVWSRELLRDDGGESPCTVWQFAADRLRGGGDNALAAYLEQARDERRVVLLLDGFDEVAPHLQPRMRDWIEALCKVDGLPVIVTSRPIGQGELASLDMLRLAEVQPLSEEQQEELVGKWLVDSDEQRQFLERLSAEPALRRLAPNPLLLSLMAWLASRRGVDKLPHTLSLLYADILRQIVEAGYKTVETGTGRIGFEHSATAVELLEEITLELLQDPDYDTVWPRDRILRAVQALPERERASLHRLAPNGPESFVLEIARTGLWSESDGAGIGYRFLHRSLGEALAAGALARREGSGDVERLAEEVRGKEGRWAEVFALFVARVAGSKEASVDAWLDRLAEYNVELARRALCWVDHASLAMVEMLLELPGDDQDRRCELFGRVRELVGDPHGAARLLGRIAQRTSDCQELWHLAQALEAIEADESVGTEAQWAAACALRESVCHPDAGFGADRPALKWCEIPEEFRSFEMGSPPDESGRDDDEGPVHPVNIQKPYWMAATPITNKQWTTFRPEHSELDERPVVDVTWFEASMFCRWLGARLPSEAEWECAARSGRQTRFCSGNDDSDLNGVGWYGNNSDARLNPVAKKNPNRSGLYDMHGNVCEWCEDTWHQSYRGAPDDGSAWVDEVSPYRVVRGGSFQ